MSMEGDISNGAQTRCERSQRFGYSTRKSAGKVEEQRNENGGGKLSEEMERSCSAFDVSKFFRTRGGVHATVVILSMTIPAYKQGSKPPVMAKGRFSGHGTLANSELYRSDLFR